MNPSQAIDAMLVCAGTAWWGKGLQNYIALLERVAKEARDANHDRGETQLKDAFCGLCEAVFQLDRFVNGANP